MSISTRNVVVALAIMFLTVPVLESCKKGPNDPGLSLKSRKGRISGDWNATKAEGSGTTSTSGWNDYNNVGLNSSSTNSTSFDGTNMTITVTQNSVSNTQIIGMVFDITFNKDGSYTNTVVTTTTFEIPGFSTTTAVATENSSGTWNFTSGVGDAKSKESIVLNETASSTSTTTTTTYNNGDPSETVTENESSTEDSNFGEVLMLDKLASDEMIVKMMNSGSNTYETTEWNPNTGDNVNVTITDSWTDETTWTFAKQ